MDHDCTLYADWDETIENQHNQLIAVFVCRKCGSRYERLIAEMLAEIETDSDSDN